MSREPGVSHLSSVPDDGRPDAKDFERWYRQYHARVRKFCIRVLRDRETAEDVAQESLLRAWARRFSFAREADIGPWLHTVARNLCMEVIRARSRVVPSDELPDRPAGDSDPVVPLEQAEERRALRTALAQMSERHRELLLLRDLHGVSYDELASRLGVSEEGARAVLFRARRGLRERFIAASRAMAALALWLRGRLQGRARRAANAVSAIQPVGLALSQAVTACTVAAALALAGGAIATASEPPAPRDAGAPALMAPTVVSEIAPAAAPAPLSREDVVRAALDRRRGDARVGGSVPNPVSGEDEHVWAHLWRDAGGGDSVVLSAADSAAAAGCSRASTVCNTLDGLAPPKE